jgi:hypothetical protein
LTNRLVRAPAVLPRAYIARDLGLLVDTLHYSLRTRSLALGNVSIRSRPSGATSKQGF